MSEDPNPSPPPAPVPPPPGGMPPYRTGDEAKGGCAFVGAVIGGFISFYLVGALCAAVAGRGGDKVATGYAIAAFAIAIWLSFKPAWRGFAIGIFLGIGAILLLIAICGGFRIGG